MTIEPFGTIISVISVPSLPRTGSESERQSSFCALRMRVRKTKNSLLCNEKDLHSGKDIDCGIHTQGLANDSIQKRKVLHDVTWEILAMLCLGPVYL